MQGGQITGKIALHWPALSSESASLQPSTLNPAPRTCHQPHLLALACRVLGERLARAADNVCPIRVRAPPSVWRCRVWGLGRGAWGVGRGLQGTGFRVQCLGFRVQGSRFRGHACSAVHDVVQPRLRNLPPEIRGQFASPEKTNPL
jgi:hypothetical protein